MSNIENCINQENLDYAIGAKNPGNFMVLNNKDLFLINATCQLKARRGFLLIGLLGLQADCPVSVC